MNIGCAQDNRSLAFGMGLHSKSDPSPVRLLHNQQCLFRMCVEFAGDSNLVLDDHSVEKAINQCCSSIPNADGIYVHNTKPKFMIIFVLIKWYCHVGIAMLYGDCHEQDICSAIQRLYRDACDGCTESMTELGHIYWSGVGVSNTPSPKMAALWYAEAAARHHPVALYCLAYLCETGSSFMKRNDLHAAFLYALASERGHVTATEKLNTIRNENPVLFDKVSQLRGKLKVLEVWYEFVILNLTPLFF